MSTSISSAITLMVVGMITVFLVLSLVYLTGNLLIRGINRWMPEDPTIHPSKSPVGVHQAISPKTIAAITTAVEVFTEGKAQIINIEKK